MHELSVTRDILNIVLKHARRNNVTEIKKIELEIGALSDLEQEWIQRYFTTLAAGSVAADARIVVKKIPCRFICSSCRSEFSADLSSDDALVCPQCGEAEVRMTSGMEYTIKSMEAV